MSDEPWRRARCANTHTTPLGASALVLPGAPPRIVEGEAADCFRSLDKEGNEEAKRQLEIERRRKKDTDYLLSKLPMLRKLIEVGEDAIPVAKALDEFCANLQEKLALDRLRLWDHVRSDGNLKIKERSKEFRRNSDGSVRTHEVEIDRVYAPLNGYEILNPSRTSCASRLQTSLRTLREYELGDSCREELLP